MTRFDTIFVGPMCHMIEVIDVHKWWDPHCIGIMELFHVYNESSAG